MRVESGILRVKGAARDVVRGRRSNVLIRSRAVRSSVALTTVHNPWLDIPLSDYEGHMALPEVDQSRMLSDEFARLLDAHRPRSIALIGCAGGNGFERIDARRTTRVVGVDINPDYLEVARSRFDGAFASLELICIDVSGRAPEIEPVELVFAGLIFEYVDAGLVLRKLAAVLQPTGTLAAVVQLPSPGKTPVTRTPFSSLRRLTPIMQLLPPEQLIGEARNAGLTIASSRRVLLNTGKNFQLLEFGVGARVA